jgi:ribose-phosphate pyrophosphokinase
MADQSYLFCTRTSKDLAEKLPKLWERIRKNQLSDIQRRRIRACFRRICKRRKSFPYWIYIPPADNLLELLLMIDAAKRASAKSITVVVLYYFGLARQNRTNKERHWC